MILPTNIPNKFVIIDDDFYETLRSHVPTLTITCGPREHIRLHSVILKKSVALSRLILNVYTDEFYNKDVDHKDRNPLNNQKANLRLASLSQNGYNKKRNRVYKKHSSKYKGIEYKRESACWIARITKSGKRIFGGKSFKNEIDAAAKRADKLMIEHHGEFACLNFPLETNVTS